MISSKEVEEQFLKELKELLEKWDAEIEVEESTLREVKMMVYIPAKYGEDEIISAESVNLNLGRYIDKDSFKEKQGKEYTKSTIPLGSWNISTGVWSPNLNLNMSVEDQIANNIKGGHSMVNFTEQGKE